MTRAGIASATPSQAAGYQALRFQSNQKPNVAELADLFAKLLPTLKPLLS